LAVSSTSFRAETPSGGSTSAINTVGRTMMF
jgi:hypothetical protein